AERLRHDLADVGPILAVGAAPRVAPPVLAARRLLPLGLGRQARVAEGAEGLGVEPGDVHHRQIVADVARGARDPPRQVAGAGLDAAPVLAGRDLIAIDPERRHVDLAAAAGVLDLEPEVLGAALGHPLVAPHPDLVDAGAVDARDLVVVEAHREGAAGHEDHRALVPLDRVLDAGADLGRAGGERHHHAGGDPGGRPATGA